MALRTPDQLTPEEIEELKEMGIDPYMSLEDRERAALDRIAKASAALVRTEISMYRGRMPGNDARL